MTAPAHAGRTRWAWLTATSLSLGYCKPGPGTWASVAATLVWLAAMYGLHLTGLRMLLASLTLALVATRIGIPAASIVERESATTDPSHVVIDEVAGQWLGLAGVAFVPPLSIRFHHLFAIQTWQAALAALVLFRVFDIVKPPPARQLERLHGGTGIMLDDLAAGAYVVLVLAVAGRLL